MCGCKQHGASVSSCSATHWVPTAQQAPLTPARPSPAQTAPSRSVGHDSETDTGPWQLTPRVHAQLDGRTGSIAEQSLEDSRRDSEEEEDEEEEEEEEWDDEASNSDDELYDPDEGRRSVGRRSIGACCSAIPAASMTFCAALLACLYVLYSLQHPPCIRDDTCSDQTTTKLAVVNDHPAVPCACR